MPLPAYLRLSLDIYLEEHAIILALLSKISKQLAQAAIDLGHGELIKNLRTIPGVGIASSTPLVVRTLYSIFYRR